jgi:hypothetical protein
MMRAAVAVLLSLAATTRGHAWQQNVRVAVAVPHAETTDDALKTVADRLTAALRSTVGASGIFELYDTSLTRKTGVGTDEQRLVAMLPTRYVCLAHVSRAIPGWAQATVSFVDAPLKDPIVRLSSPVLLSSDSTFIAFARLAWDRLTKAERKRLDSLRTR